MNGISRIELFSEIINLLDTEQQGGKWIKDIVGEMFLDDYKYLLKINIGILMDIESNYLVQSDYEQEIFTKEKLLEFSIKGSGNIRGWCSWELGSFYTKSKTKNSKFYIELYSRKDTKLNNKQLDGISPLREINMGILK